MSRPFRDRLRGIDGEAARLRAALVEFDIDWHNPSKRPCPTCDPISDILGEPWGCARYRQTDHIARQASDSPEKP